MILNLKFSNFLSFKNEAEFSFVSSQKEEQYGNLKFKNYLLNKTSVIYWANASWKTTVFKALSFIKNMIVSSHDQNLRPSTFWYKKHLLWEASSISTFEISFILEGELYSFSFSIDTETENIIDECLKKYTSQKPTILYIRRNTNEIESNKSAKFSEAESRKQFVRPQSLALSTFSNTWWELSMKIRDFFIEKIIVFLPNQDRSQPDWTFSMFDKHWDVFQKFIRNLLQSADVNIEDIQYLKKGKKIEELPNDIAKLLKNSNQFANYNWQINFIETNFKHNVYNNKWELDSTILFKPNQESTWTRRLTTLSWPMYNALYSWAALFIDEMDQSLHPLIVREIVKLFSWNKNKNAQLFFSSHDITLLNEDFLRKDQIWFTDKDKYWSSNLYSLADFKWLYKIKDIQEAYLQWKFDAIPSLNEFNYIW